MSPTGDLPHFIMLSKFHCAQVTTYLNGIKRTPNSGGAIGKSPATVVGANGLTVGINSALNAGSTMKGFVCDVRLFSR